jgi:hypothetical protein
MNTVRRIKVSLIVLAILFLSAATAMSAQEFSGFIEDYPDLEKDVDRAGALIYREPGTDMKTYTKIMIDPIEIFYSPKSKYKGINPDDLKILADTFRSSIVSALEPDYPVVSKPGPDVLGIRLAITNVSVKKKRRGLLGYTPIGLVAGGVKRVAGVSKKIILQDATIEAELLDSQSNERLGVLIDKLSASGEKKKKRSWDDVVATLDFYAKRFRGRMDEDHGR